MEKCAATTNSFSGTLTITGPKCSDLETKLGFSTASSTRAHDLLGLTETQVSSLVQFLRVVAGADTSTTVKLVNYFRDNIVNNKNRQAAEDLVELFQHSYDVFKVNKAASSNPPVQVDELDVDFKALFHDKVGAAATLAARGRGGGEGGLAGECKFAGSRRGEGACANSLAVCNPPANRLPADGHLARQRLLYDPLD